VPPNSWRLFPTPKVCCRTTFENLKVQICRKIEKYKKDGYRASVCNQPKAHFGLSWVRPWDNRGKCHMDEKKIQCLSKHGIAAYNHLSSTVYEL